MHPWEHRSIIGARTAEMRVFVRSRARRAGWRTTKIAHSGAVSYRLARYLHVALARRGKAFQKMVKDLARILHRAHRSYRDYWPFFRLR